MLSRCVLRTAQQHLEIPIRNYSEMNRQGTSWVARVAMRAFILLPGEPLLFTLLKVEEEDFKIEIKLNANNNC